jgi:hypothetical protein
MHDGNRVRKALKASTEDGATIEAVKLLDSLRSPSDNDSGFMPFYPLREAADRALKEHWRGMKSYKSASSNLDCLCHDFGDDTQLREITEEQIIQWVNTQTACKARGSTINIPFPILDVRRRLSGKSRASYAPTTGRAQQKA